MAFFLSASVAVLLQLLALEHDFPLEQDLPLLQLFALLQDLAEEQLFALSALFALEQDLPLLQDLVLLQLFSLGAAGPVVFFAEEQLLPLEQDLPEEQLFPLEHDFALLQLLPLLQDFAPSSCFVNHFLMTLIGCTLQAKVYPNVRVYTNEAPRAHKGLRTRVPRSEFATTGLTWDDPGSLDVA